MFVAAASLFAGLVAPAYSADLTDPEQEIRGFIRYNDASLTNTRRDVAYHRRPTLRGMRPRITMLVELGEDGEPADAHETQEAEGFFEAGLGVTVAGFSTYEGYTDFSVKRRSIAGRSLQQVLFETAEIRVIHPQGRSASPAEILGGLNLLVDLGSSFPQLKRLEAQLNEITSRLAAAKSPEEHRRLLHQAIENRREYGVLVHASPSMLAAWEARLRDDIERVAASAAQDADSLEEVAKYAELLADLSQRATPAPASHSPEAERWAQSVGGAVQALALYCQNRVPKGCNHDWQALQREIANWASAVTAARRQGCVEPPLTLRKLQQALAERALDVLVARRIRACGIDFALDTEEAAKIWLGPETAAAVRVADRRVSAADMSNRVSAAVAGATSGTGRTMEEAGRSLEDALRAALEPQAITSRTITADGLQWTDSSLGQMSWSDAAQRCAALRVGDWSWRLPTFEELSRLWSGGGLGALASSARTRVAGCCVWSSETRGEGSALALSVDDGKRDWLRRRLGVANAICAADDVAQEAHARSAGAAVDPIGFKGVQPATQEVYLTFLVAPEDTSIYIDGKFIEPLTPGWPPIRGSRMPAGSRTVAVPAGTHEIQLVRPGYKAQTLRMDLVPPARTLEVVLVRD